MSFSVFHSATFDKLLANFQNDFKIWLDKIEDQLVINPYVGDPIKFPWFREKKYRKYRVYYLIYEDLKAVYLVNISEKKDQQRIINTILLLLDNLKEEIINLVKK
mgnify:FL=1